MEDLSDYWRRWRDRLAATGHQPHLTPEEIRRRIRATRAQVEDKASAPTKPRDKIQK